MPLDTPIKEIQSTIRNNKDTWELAEWLYSELGAPSYSKTRWTFLRETSRNEYYDKAAELLKRIGPNGIFDA